MRKILSVTLAVVMLAALVTVFPVNAAAAAVPQLLITEVCPDSTGLSGNGSDTSDCFEFIEIYNAGETAVNLYDYTMSIGSATTGYDPAKEDLAKNVKKAAIEKVNPIRQKGLGAYNTAGTVFSGNYDSTIASYYPTNPKTATLEPGKTAVIWFVIGDAVAQAAARGKALSISDFKSYYHMDKYSSGAKNDILVVAVDANGSASTATVSSVYTATEKLEGTFNAGGVSTKEEDANGLSGRFNLYNSNTKAYGILSNAALDTALDATAPIARDLSKITYDNSCFTSYTYCNYDKADKDYNLMYKTTNDVGQAGAGSVADTSYNFICSNKAGAICNKGLAKAAGSVKYMAWDTVQFVTPGLLTASQVTNLTKTNAATYDLTFGATYEKPSANLAYARNAAIYSDPATSRISYTAYLQNFYGMADSTDSDAILAALGWTKSIYLSNGGTVRFEIKDGQLICNNLDVDVNGDAILTDAGDIDSLDGIVTVCPSSDMARVALDDYTIEYQVTYLDAQENLRYCGLVFNFNDVCSYDTLHVRVNGTANNQRRLGGSSYTTYDSKATTNTYYAANADTSAVLTSLLNKITFGTEKVKTTESTDMAKFTAAQKAEYAPMIGRTINIKIEVNQNAGPKLYVNDILIAQATTDANGKAINYYWGAQSNFGEFSLGLFVSQRVKVAIDNIKVTGWTENNTTKDNVVANNTDANGNALLEPATGDATIYVAVAMAVSFISLAALVVVKRRKNEN